MKNKEVDFETECLINTIMEGIKVKGYEALRLSDGSITKTTAYGCIAVKDDADNYYTLTVDKEVNRLNPRTGKPIRKDELFNKIKGKVN